MKFTQAVKHFLRNNPQHLSSFGRTINITSAMTPLSLPDQYNHARFDGSRVVNGKLCNTVGEYKDAWQAKYGDNP